MCPEAFFCPGSARPQPCTLGYFCPNMTEYPEPCPIGTIGNDIGLSRVEECWPCPPGQFCDSPGLVTPRGPCDPGFVCYGSANTSTPTDQVTGEVCPAGGYCPLGSMTSLPCPPGTFSNTSGSTNNFDCTECTPGFYCANARTPEPTGFCAAGYYCPGGAKTPNDTVCPAGFYSPQGSSAPIPCDVGTWMPHEAAGECYPCAAGYFCPGHGNTNVTLCLTGLHCPEGSDDPQPCPPGTYSNNTGLESPDECLPCPPGLYCTGGGLTAPEEPCFSGYVCYGSSSLPNPVESDEVIFGALCPSGHYCSEGSAAGIPCPAGTYSIGQGLDDVSQCLLCPPGMVCSTSGLISPDGVCRAGFYCIEGASHDAPVDGTTGGICPGGSFCPEGSVTFITCYLGTFANSTGQEVCFPCPAGHFCHPSVGVAPVLCSAGYFCPPGSSDYLSRPLGLVPLAP